MTVENTKKAQFTQAKKKSKGLFIIIALLVVVGTGSFWLLWGGQKSKLVSPVNGSVRVPVSAVSDGKAHFFRVAVATGEVEFFIVKSADGEIRSAFDTCDVCYKERKGYRQEGATMVCNNCNQVFPVNRINEVKGGCNPVPLERKITSDSVVIQLAALEQGRHYFTPSAR
ncbi:MAG: DUF2318 domain-containing protein [Desulfuromonadales bacterium]|nr:DUF2318 domain-containing protein [Desulfuromonadales bacterium]